MALRGHGEDPGEAHDGPALSERDVVSARPAPRTHCSPASCIREKLVWQLSEWDGSLDVALGPPQPAEGPYGFVL